MQATATTGGPSQSKGGKYTYKGNRRGKRKELTIGKEKSKTKSGDSNGNALDGRRKDSLLSRTRCCGCGQLGHMSRMCNATGASGNGSQFSSNLLMCLDSSSRRRPMEPLMQDSRPERETQRFVVTSPHMGVVDIAAVRGMIVLKTIRSPL